MTKGRIKFLRSSPRWSDGYITTIEAEDNAFYYFNDEWGSWSLIEKDKECRDFLVYDPKKRKPRKESIFQSEPPFICGGKDTTYKNLLKRVKEIKRYE